MSRANEIYGLEQCVKKELEKIERDLNKEILLNYYAQSVADGLSLARIRKRLFTMRRMSGFLGKRFEIATKEDIVRLVATIEQQHWSPWGKRDYKIILKQFYRWLRNCEPGETPQEVRWIKANIKVPSRITRKDLLVPEEVNHLIECAADIQTKAFLSVLFDSGRRLGEIFGLRICDIHFDTIGARLAVDGKTGPDMARIGASTPRLALWLDNHPDRNNPQAPLWVVTGRDGKRKQMPYATMRKRLKDTVKKAGINKRVWLYLFRHSRYAPAIHRLTDEEQNLVYGWKPGSKAKQAYIHLADEDLDQAFLKLNGMQSPSPRSEEKPYVVVACPRCKTNNSPDSKYCNGCGLAFDLSYAVGLDQRKEGLREKMDKLSTELAKSPEILDKLMEALTLLRKDDENSPEINHRKRLEE